jgi:hypothetical protein
MDCHWFWRQHEHFTFNTPPPILLAKMLNNLEENTWLPPHTHTHGGQCFTIPIGQYLGYSLLTVHDTLWDSNNPVCCHSFSCHPVTRYTIPLHIYMSTSSGILAETNVQITVFWEMVHCNSPETFHFGGRWYSALKIEASGSSGMLIPIYQTTWCHITVYWHKHK